MAVLLLTFEYSRILQVTCGIKGSNKKGGSPPSRKWNAEQMPLEKVLKVLEVIKTSINFKELEAQRPYTPWAISLYLLPQ